MANEHFEKHLTSLIEMQIKTILRYRLTPVRMAIIKKKNQMAANPGEVVRREELYSLLVGFLKMVENRYSIRPVHVSHP